ncbi:hypothetical protein V8F33_014230, partial [Rhypophila sp. PSN 637]
SIFELSGVSQLNTEEVSTVGYTEKKAPIFKAITLLNYLYIPTFPLNIVSGHRLYTSSGTFIKQKLFSASKKPLALLNFSNNGFFLIVKGVNPPKIGLKGSNHSILPVTWLYHSTYTSFRLPKEPSLLSTTPNSVALEISTPKSNSLEEESTPSEGENTDSEESRIDSEAETEPFRPPTAPKTASSTLVEAARLWHVRLGHLSLDLLKRTALVTTSLPNFQKVRIDQLCYKNYNVAKMLRKPSKKPVKDPAYVLDRIKGDIFVIRPILLNNKPYSLVLINQKLRFRVLRLLKTKAYFHYDRGLEIRGLLLYLKEKGISYTKRSIRVLLERLRAIIVASALPPTLWGYIIGLVVELINRSATTT